MTIAVSQKKDPAEVITLSAMFEGKTVTSIDSVTAVSVPPAADPSAASIVAGAPIIDPSNSSRVLVAIGGGLSGVRYDIKFRVRTPLPYERLAITARLTVAEGV